MVIICNKPFDTSYNEDYKTYFDLFSPINLSSFQKWAIKAIVDNDNVLVTAHTGSGKTLPAEFAIQYFTQRKKRLFMHHLLKHCQIKNYSTFVANFLLYPLEF